MMIYFVSLLQTPPSTPANPQHSYSVRQYASHFCYTIDSLLVVHREISYRQVEFAGAEKEFIVSPTVLNSPIP